MSLSSLFGQKTIKGRILDGELEPLSFADIYNTDTIIGSSDLNGYFKLTIPDETSKIIFRYFRFEPLTISFNNNCKYFEVIMLSASTYDKTSNRKIDKLRRKEYNKLAKLYRRAFNEGKFINKGICYTFKFIPRKPALDTSKKKEKELKKINKKDFKELNIGDVVKIPFGIDTSENKNIVSTYYASCKNCTEKDYDYLIEGVIVKKYKRNLTLEIKITKILHYDFLRYKGEILTVDSNFKYEMKYFEVIIDKNNRCSPTPTKDYLKK